MIPYTQRFVLGIMLFVVAQRTELSAAVFRLVNNQASLIAIKLAHQAG
jgi:hypothetical protein